MDADHVYMSFNSDEGVNGDGFEIGFRCLTGDTRPVRPYPSPTYATPAEHTPVHVAVVYAVAEGFKMFGRLFNFLSTVSDS